MRIRHSHSAIPWQGHVLCRRALISSGQAADFCDQRPAGVLSGDDGDRQRPGDVELRVIPTESLLIPRLVGSADLVLGLGVIGEGLKAVRNVGCRTRARRFSAVSSTVSCLLKVADSRRMSTAAAKMASARTSHQFGFAEWRHLPVQSAQRAARVGCRRSSPAPQSNPDHSWQTHRRRTAARKTSASGCEVRCRRPSPRRCRSRCTSL